MAAPKGRPKPVGSGRQKGVGNKNASQLRDMILNALDKAGGEEYLYNQAIENPGPFLTLIGKVLPKDVVVSGDESNPISISVSINGVTKDQS